MHSKNCGFLRQRGAKPCNHCISGAFANYEAHHFLTFPDLHGRGLTFPDFRIRKNRIATDSIAFLCLALLSFAFVCSLLLLLCFRLLSDSMLSAVHIVYVFITFSLQKFSFPATKKIPLAGHPAVPSPSRRAF